MSNRPDHLLAECEKIEENCLYTAQTHFLIAAQKRKRSTFWLLLLPSAISSASGLAVALGAKAWVGAFAAVAGVISGVSSFLDVGKEAVAHETAAKLLTQTRDEARSLRETHSIDMTAQQFSSAVRAVGDRYRAYVASLPVTDDALFEKARAKVKSGAFQFDSAISAQDPQGDSPLPPTGTKPALPPSQGSP